MKTHTSLKNLYDYLYSLEFSTAHIKTRASDQDGFTVDVEKRTACNGHKLSDFPNAISSMVDTMVESESQNLNKYGNEYKLTLMDIIIELDKLPALLLKNGEFQGHVSVVPEKDLYQDEAYELGALEYRNITDLQEPQSLFFKVVEDQLAEAKTKLSQLLLTIFDAPPAPVQKKMVWDVGPAAMAAFLNEIRKKGWVKPELTNGKHSPNKTADLADQIFEFKGTRGSLYNALIDSDSIEKSKREEIKKIPPAELFNN